MASSSKIEVEVPGGLNPGDEMLVQTQLGHEFVVVIPPGVVAGSMLEVDLPAPDCGEL